MSLLDLGSLVQQFGHRSPEIQYLIEKVLPALGNVLGDLTLKLQSDFSAAELEELTNEIVKVRTGVSPRPSSGHSETQMMNAEDEESAMDGDNLNDNPEKSGRQEESCDVNAGQESYPQHPGGLYSSNSSSHILSVPTLNIPDRVDYHSSNHQSQSQGQNANSAGISIVKDAAREATPELDIFDGVLWIARKLQKQGESFAFLRQSMTDESGNPDFGPVLQDFAELEAKQQRDVEELMALVSAEEDKKCLEVAKTQEEQLNTRLAENRKSFETTLQSAQNELQRTRMLEEHQSAVNGLRAEHRHHASEVIEDARKDVRKEACGRIIKLKNQHIAELEAFKKRASLVLNIVHDSYADHWMEKVAEIEEKYKMRDPQFLASIRFLHLAGRMPKLRISRDLPASVADRIQLEAEQELDAEEARMRKEMVDDEIIRRKEEFMRSRVLREQTEKATMDDLRGLLDTLILQTVSHQQVLHVQQDEVHRMAGQYADDTDHYAIMFSEGAQRAQAVFQEKEASFRSQLEHRFDVHMESFVEGLEEKLRERLYNARCDFMKEQEREGMKSIIEQMRIHPEHLLLFVQNALRVRHQYERRGLKIQLHGLTYDQIENGSDGHSSRSVRTTSFDGRATGMSVESKKSVDPKSRLRSVTHQERAMSSMSITINSPHTSRSTVSIPTGGIVFTPSNIQVAAAARRKDMNLLSAQGSVSDSDNLRANSSLSAFGAAAESEGGLESEAGEDQLTHLEEAVASVDRDSKTRSMELSQLIESLRTYQEVRQHMDQRYVF
eukprot:ANDGO_00146.mRNA.1 hypothetical protein